VWGHSVLYTCTLFFCLEWLMLWSPKILTLPPGKFYIASNERITSKCKGVEGSVCGLSSHHPIPIRRNSGKWRKNLDEDSQSVVRESWAQEPPYTKVLPYPPHCPLFHLQEIELCLASDVQQQILSTQGAIYFLNFLCWNEKNVLLGGLAVNAMNKPCLETVERYNTHLEKRPHVTSR
jgi:hypothetical protein